MIASDAQSFTNMVAKEIDHVHLNRKLHINKLSSGRKLNNSSDDIGALSNLLRQKSDSKRSIRLQESFQNAISFTQVQSGALNSVSEIYSRMSELAVKALDSTKNNSDRENYDREFQELRSQSLQIDLESFNGKALFRNTVYEIITTGQKSWEDARSLAEKANNEDSEYNHYMATITSLEEQQEIERQLGNVIAGQALWLGGSDSNIEGEWRWVEGPEGMEDGGFGRQFWQGKGSGSGGYAVNDSFTNWNGTREPNDSDSDEDALQILSTNGLWNDLPDSDRQLSGYLQESDPLNIRIGDDHEDGFFELTTIDFKRFLPSTTIDLKTLANAQDALTRLSEATEDVIDKLAIIGSNELRLVNELRQLQSTQVEKLKSLSRIEDTDMARAATQLAKAEIKIQSNASVFAQANELFNKRNYVAELL